VTGPALALVPAPGDGAGEEFGHVLSGVILTGDAMLLAAALDREFLAEAGWDPETRVLSMPASHPLLGRQVCRTGGCTATVHGSGKGGLCYQCSSRLARAGWIPEEIRLAEELPPLPDRADGCLVPGCQRMSPGGRQGQRTGLCQAHSRRLRRVPGARIDDFLADPRVRPLPPLGPCRVAACSRRSESEHGYCPTHYVRWRTSFAAVAGADQEQWDLACPAVAEPGRVSLRGLAPLVVVQVLAGIQYRVRSQGAKIKDVNLRAVCDGLRRQHAASAVTADPEQVTAGKPARALLRAFARHSRLALADPAREQLADTWDLAVFGHPGGLSFAGITQSWLREAAKAWAADDLPRHRGGGAGNVRTKITAIARLSESLRCRDDRGEDPQALGRPDAEAFLNRLGYLESAGTISRYQRNVICRGARFVLTGIRALGLTRPGQPAAGLPGDFTVGLSDIPPDPVRGEPGRDLPAEVMSQLCASLDTLEPAEARTAIAVAIDTGRRPEDILGLPLDCLDRDRDGAAVLVYDNVKADRPGRRLPVGEATADVITAQQARVRARCPGESPGTLKLLPAPRANPHGRKPMSIAMLDDRHRDWVTSLGPLRTRDGSELSPDRLIPYAYRHTYAQRHADAGVPIDVLAELLDHRNLNVTRRYYRVGEERRRDAVDKVTAMSFDRHGNRVWRDARALLESE
jgi:integrase